MVDHTRVSPARHGLEDHLLEIRGVSLGFGGIKALSDVSFDVQNGVIAGLIGPNGAGKTSLFNCITGFYTPDSGSIRFGSCSLEGMGPDRAAGLGIARTFQNVGLIRGLTVEENVMLGAYHRSRLGFVASALGLPGVRRHEAAFRQEAAAVLEQVDLGDIRHRLPDGLPFGTQKRIELARALMVHPRLLLLDEPANGLVHDEVFELAETVRSIAQERSLSILLVEHHMGLVMSLCERIVVLDFGQVIATGTPHEVQDDPAVIEAYLGAIR